MQAVVKDNILRKFVNLKKVTTKSTTKSVQTSLTWPKACKTLH